MTIALKLDPGLEAALVRIAAERGQTPEELVGETLREYVDYLEAEADPPPGLTDIDDTAAYIAAVEAAEAEIDAGLGVAHHEVVAEFGRRFPPRR